MLDHIGLAVSDLERSRRFYLAALPPLGIGVEMEVTAEETGSHAHLGFGATGRAFFWINGGAPTSGPIHVAFAAAMAAGGIDNGAPGLRPQYHAKPSSSTPMATISRPSAAQQLDLTGPGAHPPARCQVARRPRAGERSPVGGKSGLHGRTVPANGRRGSYLRESATENKPPGRAPFSG